MRLQPLHVRAAAIAAVLAVFSACAADGPVDPAAADFRTDATSETTSSPGILSAAIAKASATSSNSEPTAWISKPAHNSTWARGASIAFSGTGRDPEDGQLTGASLVWTSSIDGQIGTGKSFTHSGLSSGEHTITLTGTDSDGASFSHNRLITVSGPVNSAPVATISSPASGATVAQGTSVSFAGSASDAESGALSGSALVWYSSLAGQIGTGTSFSTSALAAGSHTISLVARDPAGAADTVTRSLTINAVSTASNEEPFGLISSPAHGSSYAQGASVSFRGSATDPEDGTLSGASIVWTSSRDGQIGTGTSFYKSNLSVGSHTITMTSTDSRGASFSHNRVITIAAGVTNTPPVANFTANCVLLVCTFDASSSSDNAGIVNYGWNFGSGSIINRTTALISNTFLVAGTVNVTLTVRDAAGLIGTITKAVTMSSGTTTTATSGLGMEPSGMTKLTETGLNCVTGCTNWSFANLSYAGGVTMVPDLTAPVGGSGVVQQNYTPSLSAGTSPGSFSVNPTQKQTIYVAIWMKLSSNYQGHSSGVNKVLHFFSRPGTSGNNIAIFNIRGSGSGTLVPAFLMQGLVTGNMNLDAPSSVCTTVRGRWTKYEMVLQNNTPGVANGTATLWMDGKKCVEKTGIAFVDYGEINKWSTVKWSPTWGGVGGSPTTTFYEAVDHIYISGK